ncbi:MAG TPA: hypothetical protein VGK25_04925 [Ignavibacteria bacterium]|jgi:hypothetical protein
MKKFTFLLVLFLLLVLFSKDSYSQTGNNALLEFCTGTWCQWCPCGDDAAEQILINYPKHNGAGISWPGRAGSLFIF